MELDNNKITFITLLLSILPIALIMGTGASELIILITNIYFIFLVFSKKKITINLKDKNLIVFLIFWVYLIFNSVVANNEISWIRNISHIRFFIFIIAINQLYSFNLINLNIIFKFWLIILSVTAFDLIFQFSFGFNIIGYELPKNIYRNSGFFFEEMKAGGFLIGFLFLSLSFFLRKNTNNYKIFLLLLFIVISIFFTGERGNTIRSLLFLSIFIILIPENFFKLKKILFLSLISFMIIIYLNSNFIKGRFSNNELINETGKKLNLKQKYYQTHYGEHFLTALLMFKDNIYFGVGNKNYRNKCYKYQPILIQEYQLKGRGCATHPHQIYYEFFSEHGLFGFLVMAFLFFSIIKINLRSSYRQNPVMLSTLIYICLTFLPLMPAGSFFTSFGATIFWLNVAFFIMSKNIKY